MERFSLFVSCLIALSAALPVVGQNLLYNPDMSLDDGFGAPIGWEEKIIRGTLDGASEKAWVEQAGPGENPARVVTLRFPHAKVFLRQSPFALVPGEEYRMFAWVRTRSLGTNRVAMTCWDAGWNSEVWSDAFPSDTAGKWQRVEMGGEDARFSFGRLFVCSGGMHWRRIG